MSDWCEVLITLPGGICAECGRYVDGAHACPVRAISELQRAVFRLLRRLEIRRQAEQRRQS